MLDNMEQLKGLELETQHLYSENYDNYLGISRNSLNMKVLVFQYWLSSTEPWKIIHTL